MHFIHTGLHETHERQESILIFAHFKHLYLYNIHTALNILKHLSAAV